MLTNIKETGAVALAIQKTDFWELFWRCLELWYPQTKSNICLFNIYLYKKKTSALAEAKGRQPFCFHGPHSDPARFQWATTVPADPKKGLRLNQCRRQGNQSEGAPAESGWALKYTEIFHIKTDTFP